MLNGEQLSTGGQIQDAVGEDWRGCTPIPEVVAAEELLLACQGEDFHIAVLVAYVNLAVHDERLGEDVRTRIVSPQQPASAFLETIHEPVVTHRDDQSIVDRDL